MTLESSNLTALFRALRDAEAPVEDEAAQAARRRRVVHRMEGALRAVASARARGERQRRILAGVAVAALVLLAAMRASPCIRLDTPLPLRVALLEEVDRQLLDNSEAQSGLVS